MTATSKTGSTGRSHDLEDDPPGGRVRQDIDQIADQLKTEAAQGLCVLSFAVGRLLRLVEVRNTEVTALNLTIIKMTMENDDLRLKIAQLGKPK